jgi:hypothetical protein
LAINKNIPLIGIVAAMASRDHPNCGSNARHWMCEANADALRARKISVPEGQGAGIFWVPLWTGAVGDVRVYLSGEIFLKFGIWCFS